MGSKNQYGPRALKSLRPNDRHWALLVDVLWRELPGLYFEKFLSYPGDPDDPKQKFLKGSISDTVDFGQYLGQDHLLEGNRSAAFGQGAVTKSFMEIVLGAYNLIPEGQNAEEWIPTDLLLTLGNGPDKDHRSNVFEIFKNGLFRFLQAIVIGAYPALPEGHTPRPGAIQYTPENGFEKWNETTQQWDPLAGGITNNYITNIINNTYVDNITIINNVTTVIELTTTPEANTVRVYLNGVRQHPDTYSVVGDTVVLDTAPLKGDTVMVDYVGVSEHGSIYNETPSGLINGVNVNFTLAHVPTGGVRVYLNGIRQMAGTHYTVTGATITFAHAPIEGDELLTDYQY